MAYTKHMIKDAIVRFDSSVTIFVTQWPSWVLTPMLIITNVGQPIVMALAAIAVGVWAWHHSHTRITVSMGATLIAMGINSVLKHYVHRTRPDTLYVSEMYFKTSSFPSGHAFSAMVVCALFAFLAVKYIPGMWGWISATALVVFALLVGISRIVVGAHYPTDVLAGWLLGIFFAVLIIVVVKP